MTFSRGEADKLYKKSRGNFLGFNIRANNGLYWPLIAFTIFRTYTSPENPINAIASIEAVISAIGTP